MTPPSGPPGTNVSLSGNIGYASCSFVVRLESVDLGSGISASNGDVQLAFAIPSNSDLRDYTASLIAIPPYVITPSQVTIDERQTQVSEAS